MLLAITAALAVLSIAVPRAARADADVFGPCLGEKRKEKLHRLTRMSKEQEAFRPSGIWLPPLFVSDSTRRFRWIGGVYADFADPEEDAFTRLVLPLMLQDCRPGSRLLVTPLFGSRRDEAGIAGVIGPYFYRRDALASSDVLFPLVWSLRERELEGGPITWRNSAVVPFYFDWQRGEERTVLIPPLLFGRKRDAAGVAGVVGPYYYRRDRLGASDVLFPLVWSQRQREREGGPVVWRNTVVAPFYFDHQRGERRSIFIPPLLSGRITEGERRTWITGPYFRTVHPEGWTAGFVPFWIGGREGERRWDVVPPLLLHREAWPGHLRVRVALAKYERDPGEWKFKLPPLIWAGGDGVESWAVALPVFGYWHKRDRFRFTLVGPWFSYHRRSDEFTEGDDRKWLAGLVPLWLGGRKGDHRWDLVPPLLMWWSRGDGEPTFTALGSWYHRDAEGFTLGLTPLVYVARRPERQHTLVLPFFGHLKSPERRTTFVGPAWSTRTEEGFSHGVFPLWMAWGGEGRRVDVVPPLLTLRISDDHGERVRLWSLNSWYFKDRDGYRAGSFPFFFAKREGKRHSLFIPPLATYHAGDGTDETTVILGSWYRKRPDGYSLGITPLLFAGREGSKRHFVLLPLVWDFDDGWTRTTLVLNTFYQRRVDGWRAGFVPFYFGGKTGDRRWDLVPPLFVHFGDGKKDTWLFGPLYRHRTARGWHAGLAPFYFGGRDATGGYDIVPPLLFARWRNEQGTRLWAANTWYRHRPDGTFSFTSFPLAFAGRTEERHWLTIPPLLFHHSGSAGAETTVAGPLYLSKVGEKRTRALFPFFYSRRTPEASLDLALPGFYRYRTDHSWEAGLLPLWAGGENEWRSFHIIPPLFAYWQKSETELRVGALNTRYVKRPDGHSFTFFPLVFEGRRNDRRHLIVPPLFFDLEGPRRRFTLAGPFYRSRSDTGWRAGLFPLYLGARTTEHDFDLLPPLLTWRHRHGDRKTLVTGPFYRVKDDDGWRSGLFPLYFGARTREGDFDLVPPALFYRRVRGENRTLVAGPYFQLRRGEDRASGLLPLYVTARGQGQRWTIIPPLMAAYSRGPDRSFFWMFNTWHRREGSGAEADISWGSFPLVFGRKSGERSSVTLPPLLMHFGKSPRGRTTWVGPVFHRKTESRTTTVVGPAFFTRRDARWSAGLVPLLFAGGGEGHAHAALPPLFFYNQRPGRTRMTLFPLMHYRRDGETSTLYTPLAFYRGHPEGHAFYSPLAVSYRDRDRHLRSVVGLYWSGAGPDIAATVVAPFYWDLRFPKSGTRFTALAPFYWSYRSPEEETHILLNIAWSSGVGPRGPSYSFRVVPFFSYQRYHPDHLKWQVLEGLAGFEREGERKRYRAFYIWTRPTTG